MAGRCTGIMTRALGWQPPRADVIGPLLSQMACEYPAGECYIRAARYLADAPAEVALAAQGVGLDLLRKHGSPWDVRWPALPCWEQYAGDALWRLGRDRLQRLCCEARWRLQQSRQAGQGGPGELEA